jgi:hypothetical protein
VANAPNPTEQAVIIHKAFGPGEIAERAVIETRAKAVNLDQYRARLTLLARTGPILAAPCAPICVPRLLKPATCGIAIQCLTS